MNRSKKGLKMKKLNRGEGFFFIMIVHKSNLLCEGNVKHEADFK